MKYSTTQTGLPSCPIILSFNVAPIYSLYSNCVVLEFPALFAFHLFSPLHYLTWLLTTVILLLQLGVFSLLWSAFPMSWGLELLPPSFLLLGRGKILLENPDYSVWDVSSSCSSRRRRLQNKFESRFTCTVTDEERAWTSLNVDPKSSGSTSSSPTHRVTSSTSKSPKTPLPSSKFAVPGPIPVGSSGGSSRGFEQTLQLATATLAVPRFVSEVPFLPPDQTKSAKKLSKKKRPSLPVVNERRLAVTVSIDCDVVCCIYLLLCSLYTLFALLQVDYT